MVLRNAGRRYLAKAFTAFQSFTHRLRLCPLGGDLVELDASPLLAERIMNRPSVSAMTDAVTHRHTYLLGLFTIQYVNSNYLPLCEVRTGHLAVIIDVASW